MIAEVHGCSFCVGPEAPCIKLNMRVCSPFLKIAAAPVAGADTWNPMRTGTPSATRLDIEKMGLWVTDLLSDAQLAAAAERYHASIPLTKQFLVPLGCVNCALTVFQPAVGSNPACLMLQRRTDASWNVCPDDPTERRGVSIPYTLSIPSDPPWHCLTGRLRAGRTL